MASNTGDLLQQIERAVATPFGTHQSRNTLAQELGLTEVMTDAYQGTLAVGGAGQCYWYFEDDLVIGFSWVQPPPETGEAHGAALNSYGEVLEGIQKRFGPAHNTEVGAEWLLGEKTLVLRAPDEDEAVVTLALTRYRTEFFDE